jgi:hypothetical protein
MSIIEIFRNMPKSSGYLPAAFFGSEPSGLTVLVPNCAGCAGFVDLIFL